VLASAALDSGKDACHDAKLTPAALAALAVGAVHNCSINIFYSPTAADPLNALEILQIHKVIIHFQFIMRNVLQANSAASIHRVEFFSTFPKQSI
jgi:hypothetical protein